MKNEADQCQGCGAWTRSGKEKLAKSAEENPLSGIDLKRPKDIVIEDIRNDLTGLRNNIQDFKRAFPGWSERLSPVEGLMTCGIIALFYVIKELEDFERNQKAFEARGKK